MASRTLISVEEYLRTSYSPDCDYVDGEVLERNVGEWDHGDLQLAIGSYLRARQKKFGIRVVVEQRVQVTPGRFRVPDVCVVLGDPGEQVLRKPPFICIEILSPEDRMSRVEEQVDDFIKMGVPNVWVIDPATKHAWTITQAEGWRSVTDAILKTANPSVEVPLSEIFIDE